MKNGGKIIFNKNKDNVASNKKVTILNYFTILFSFVLVKVMTRKKVNLYLM